MHQQTEVLLPEIQKLVIAKWRYQGCWIVSKPDGWRVYCAKHDCWLAGGFPGTRWAAAPFAAIYSTPEWALEALMYAEFPKHHGIIRKTKEDLLQAISVESLVQTWMDRCLKPEAKPAPKDTMQNPERPPDSPSSQSVSISSTKTTWRLWCGRLLASAQKLLGSWEQSLTGQHSKQKAAD